MQKGSIVTTRYASPAGDLILGSYGDRLCMCDWMQSRRHDANIRRLCHYLNARCVEGESEVLQDAVAWLDNYFAGRSDLRPMPIKFAGTDFQCRVWDALLDIPYSATISYAELARRVGNQRAVRAVAAACAANTLTIFVPCHRVTGSNDRLGGYAGGLKAKPLLLDLEASNKSI